MEDLLLVVTVIGILIPFIFGILLLFIRHPNKRAQSILIFGFVFAIIGYLFELLNHLKFYYSASIFFLFYTPVIFAIYPLLYIYLKCIIWKEICLSIKLLLKYFFITLLVLILTWIYYLPLPFESKIIFFSYIMVEFPIDGSDATIFLIIIILYYLQAIIYIYAFAKIAIYVNKRGKERIILEEEYLPRWVWVLAHGIFSYEIITSGIFILFDMSPKLTIITNIFITNTFLLFLGFFGFKQYDLSVHAKLKKLTDHFKNENEARKTSNKLSNSQKNNIAETILEYISSKKLYLDPNLKIDKLAKQIHIPHKNLSLVINELLGKSFTTILNEYRVEEAKNFIASSVKIESLEEIYTQVGFNSRSTFNRVFKSYTGQTPSEYLDSINSDS